MNMFLGLGKTTFSERSYFKALSVCMIGLRTSGIFCHVLMDRDGTITKKLHLAPLLWMTFLNTCHMLLSIISIYSYSLGNDEASSIGVFVWSFVFLIHHITNNVVVLTLGFKSSRLAKILEDLVKLDQYIAKVEVHLKPEATREFSYVRLYYNHYHILSVLLTILNFVILLQQPTPSKSFGVGYFHMMVTLMQVHALYMMLFLHQLIFKLLATNLVRSVQCVVPWYVRHNEELLDHFSCQTTAKFIPGDSENETSSGLSIPVNRIPNIRLPYDDISKLQFLANVFKKIKLLLEMLRDIGDVSISGIYSLGNHTMISTASVVITYVVVLLQVGYITTNKPE
ncbi:hypothetical protein SK128_021253 [Halocaridina rubra]|uniref:Uncharacterized protein n=1 Tax=Halocaridina rubra TaxID=373956 RepID=A0AAN8ZV91_HALRR